MPFARAVNQDRHFKWIVMDNADNFWKEHAKDQIPVDSVSENCKSLIFALLYRQPELRPSIVDVLQDAWFKE